MPETGHHRPREAPALRVDDADVPPSRRTKLQELGYDPPLPASLAGCRVLPSPRPTAMEEPPEAVPIAWFSLEGHQCEVIPFGVAADGKEVLGTLALDGRTYLVLSVAPDPDAADLANLLTPRELEIALLVASGWDAKAIGRRLDISFHTVRVHMGRLYGKLRIHKQSELAAHLAKHWPLPPTQQTNSRHSPASGSRLTEPQAEREGRGATPTWS